MKVDVYCKYCGKYGKCSTANFAETRPLGLATMDGLDPRRPGLNPQVQSRADDERSTAAWILRWGRVLLKGWVVAAVSAIITAHFPLREGRGAAASLIAHAIKPNWPGSTKTETPPSNNTIL